MNDIYRYELWKTMSIRDILKYCKTNKKFMEICNDPNTWRFLLMRDYNEESITSNPKKEYVDLYKFEKAKEKYKDYSIDDLIEILYMTKPDIAYAYTEHIKENEDGYPEFLENIWNNLVRELIE